MPPARRSSLFGTTPAPAAARRRTRRADVCVVGAGLAGLAAARALVAADRTVVVLEARDRVGGRTLNAPIGAGHITEVGGEFVGPTQDRILALARAVGVKTFATYNTGSNVLIAGGARSLYAAVPGLPDDPEIQQAILASLKLDALAKQAGVSAPWKAKQAKAWDRDDARRLDAGTRSRAPKGQAIFISACQAIWGADPKELSLLYVLQYTAAAGNAKTAGSFLRLITTGGGAQESRFVGGSQVISEKVADRLGKRVVLKAPVTVVAQDGDGVRVVAGATTVQARHVILAVPPALAVAAGLLAGVAQGQGAAAQGARARHPDQGRGRLRPPVLARRRAQRAGRRRRRRGDHDLRQLAARRLGRRALRVHRRLGARPVVEAAGRPAARPGAREPRRLRRRPGAHADATTSSRTGPRSAGRAAAPSPTWPRAC